MWKAHCVKCTRHCTLVWRAASRTEGNKKGTALYSNKKWLKIQWPMEVRISFSNTTSYKSPPAWLHVLAILKALGLFSNLTIPSWEWAKGFSSSKSLHEQHRGRAAFPFLGAGDSSGTSVSCPCGRRSALENRPWRAHGKKHNAN